MFFPFKKNKHLKAKPKNILYISKPLSYNDSGRDRKYLGKFW